MSEEIKTNTENAEYDATQRWDDLAEEMDWLEDQAKNGDEATRAKAAKYIAQNIEYMSKILKEIDGNAQEEPKSETVAESGGLINDYASGENERDAVEERKPREIVAGQPLEWLTDKEASERMYEEHQA